MFKDILIIGIGGAAGSILRYTTGQYISKNYPHAIPFGTLTVNILGCLIIGILIGIFDRHALINPQWKLLLITGFCGGFTTFSTFAAENFQLMQNNQIPQAFLYIALSVILGLMAIWGGLLVAKAIG
ncbi:fluoride efflux transporter CrcB [Sphingobacterium humi]|uniref:Fluoride-specific ion channel FluC n=1 Tax=Sphingobacterium humi TaxID=1796905 RepID=A0A6N8L391_9SPHI|nr:fluoride efflux transporter CrcB [Sphingobacterium humi]MVZ62618.1 fluoride efflux transporter CrcB [Sphingobacterium humi]